jgi:N-carbamoylputrescine amidase
MKVTVCELHDEPEIFLRDWDVLSIHIREEGSDLVLLPEMPFYTWFPRSPRFDPEVWQEAVEAHQVWLSRLADLAPAWVLATRPAEAAGGRVNEGFAWDLQGGVSPAHIKHYLPDEEGFWEATWFGRGPGDFEHLQVAGARVGFAICTELWFFERARLYGRQGIHILANPRGTLASTREKWLVAGRAAALVSGAFVLSSNRVGPLGGDPLFGGQGWVVGPEGQVLGLTSPDQPFVTLDIDLRQADQARKTYPRYVEE